MEYLLDFLDLEARLEAGMRQAYRQSRYPAGGSHRHMWKDACLCTASVLVDVCCCPDTWKRTYCKNIDICALNMGTSERSAFKSWFLGVWD